MPDQPNPRDLIGGYATSTLSREEREQLLAAALDDQQLFDELVNEEPLRELLNDTLARQKLIDKLSGEQRARDRWFHLNTWRLGFSRPKYLAYGGLVLLIVVGAIVVSLLRPAGPTQESRPEKIVITLGPPSVRVTPTPIGARSDQNQGLSAEQLDLLRKRLLEYEASSARLEALEKTTAALRLQPDNPELKRILEAALREAGARLSLARARATAAGELARRSSDYQNAMQYGQDVERLARSGSTEAAILSAWSATDLFTRASEESTSLFVPLGRAGPGTAGWVTVAAPADVQVFEGDRFIGSNRIDRIMLPVGRHDLDIVNESLRYRERRSVQITAGDVSSVRLNWPNGTLAINAVPWAEAFVDGMRVGETPIGSIEVAIGVHEIVLRHPEFGERRQTVTVTLGVPAKVVVDLRTKAMTPQSQPRSEGPAPPPQEASSANTARMPRIYDSNDADVFPPVAVRQELPPVTTTIPTEKKGVLVIVIDETGSVESAIITEPLDKAYDQRLLAATKAWSYRPATRNGMAVKYRKRIQLMLFQTN